MVSRSKKLKTQMLSLCKYAMSQCFKKIVSSQMWTHIICMHNQQLNPNNGYQYFVFTKKANMVIKNV